MAERITSALLNTRVQLINKALGTPTETYQKVDNKHVANPGNHHIDYQNGLVSLRKMSNVGGGSSSLFGGSCTKRELYNLMGAFLEGVCSCKEQFLQASNQQ